MWRSWWERLWDTTQSPLVYERKETKATPPLCLKETHQTEVPQENLEACDHEEGVQGRLESTQMGNRALKWGPSFSPGHISLCRSELPDSRGSGCSLSL